MVTICRKDREIQLCVEKEAKMSILLSQGIKSCKGLQVILSDPLILEMPSNFPKLNFSLLLEAF